jgi:chromosome segregation ATPase
MGIAEEAVQALGAGAHQLTVQIVAAEKDIERLEFERPQCCSRRDVVRYEIDSLVEEEQSAAAEQGTMRLRHDELGALHQTLEQALVEARAETDDAVARAEALTSQVTTVKVRVAERRERQASAAAAVEALHRSASSWRTPDGAAGGARAGRARAHDIEQDVVAARRAKPSRWRAHDARRRRRRRRRRWRRRPRGCARSSSASASRRARSTSCARPRARRTSPVPRRACAASIWSRR